MHILHLLTGTVLDDLEDSCTVGVGARPYKNADIDFFLLLLSKCSEIK